MLFTYKSLKTTPKGKDFKWFQIDDFLKLIISVLNHKQTQKYEIVIQIHVLTIHFFFFCYIFLRLIRDLWSFRSQKAKLINFCNGHPIF